MKQLGNLIERIVERININLRDFGFDADPYVRETIPLRQLSKFYAFCG
ncbi:MAG: transferase, partial [Deltaproteobacteria bacterium]|nr:transferase [Deltaproteobacteria bacterium]